MAASNTRFTQNSLGQSKTPIDSDHGIYRTRRYFITLLSGAVRWRPRSEAPKRESPYPTWRRSGCGWRITTKPGQ